VATTYTGGGSPSRATLTLAGLAQTFALLAGAVVLRHRDITA
jgi:hypothetical protein